MSGSETDSDRDDTDGEPANAIPGLGTEQLDQDTKEILESLAHLAAQRRIEEEQRKEEEDRRRYRRNAAISVGVLVAVIAVLYNINTDKYFPGKADVICPHFTFNATTLNNKLFLYQDDTKLSNYKMEEAATSSDEKQGERRLKKYKGVIGITLQDNADPLSFAVGISIHVNNHIPDNKLLFQIGICREDIIDTSNTLGLHKEAWSVSAVGCQGKHVCLQAANDDRVLSSTPLSDNSANTRLSAKLKFNSNLKSNTFVIKMMPGSKIVGDFHDVDFSLPLRPVFAVFNPHLANVSLSLVGDGSDIAFDLTTMHSRLYVSEDQRTIANVPLSSAFLGGTASGSLLKYPGVIGDILFTAKTATSDLPYFFEVVVSIKRFYKHLLRKDDFIFEVGFTRKHLVDKESSLRSHSSAWVVDGSRCRKSVTDICLKAWNGNQIYNELTLQKFSSVEQIEGTISVTFKIFPAEGKLRISVRRPRKRLHTFTGISFHKPLYPVFGLTVHPKVSMLLKTGTNIDRFSLFGYHFKEPVCKV